MKTEDILRYDRMYRAMKLALDADIITFGFWAPRREALKGSLPKAAATDTTGSPTYTHLAAEEPL